MHISVCLYCTDCDWNTTQISWWTVFKEYNITEIQHTRPALPYEYACFADGYYICIRIGYCIRVNCTQIFLIQMKYPLQFESYDRAGRLSYISLLFLLLESWLFYVGTTTLLRNRFYFIWRGEEGQLHQSLVRTTFSSFSRPNHIEILVLSILFFYCVRSLKINTFFKKYGDVRA